MKPTTLLLYNSGANVKISIDASSFGLGAVLLQQSEGSWTPVAYASCSMTQAERRFAQIGKEVFAITWACQRFSDYVLGCKFTIESDHKPLIPLLNTKHLDALPLHVVQFRLRLAKFDYVVTHVPGKILYTADTPSCAPIPETGDSDLDEEVQTLVDGVVQYSLPASKGRLEYKEAQEQDSLLAQVCQYCEGEWPEKKLIPPVLIPYYQARNSLTVCNDMLLFNERIVVSKALGTETLQKKTLWTPRGGKMQGQSSYVGLVACCVEGCSEIVQNCRECAKQSVVMEKNSNSYTFAWQLVGTDLFEMDQRHHLWWSIISHGFLR